MLAGVRALILAPHGRDAAVAASLLAEANVACNVVADLNALTDALNVGAGVAIIADEALRTADLVPLRSWLDKQPAWSDFPFVVLTERGGGVERNPFAARISASLGNVSFLERPFHPTTLSRAVETALRGRMRQYEARARIDHIREAEQRLQIALMAGRLGSWEIDVVDMTFTASATCRAIFGREADEAVSYNDLYRSTHCDDRERLRDALAESVGTGDDCSVEFRHCRNDGSVRWIEMRGRLVASSEGGPSRLVGVILDITERKNAEVMLERRVAERTAELAMANRELAAQSEERRKAEAALRRAQRLEAVGQLTSGVAHDFNNLLTVIRGGVELLTRVTTSADLLRPLEMMRNAAERGARLTAQLLAFSRQQKLEPRALQLNDALHSMHDLLQSTIGGSFKVESHLQPGLWPALVDPTQFELMVLNLAINARDAMVVGGSLTIETANVSLGPPDRPEAPRAGDYVMVTVSDTGTGMTDEVLEKALEPFFTTKEVGKGSGLGLSQVLGLAQQSGGGLRIDTTVGVGTAIRVYLPRTHCAIDVAATAAAASPQVARPGTRVLVVDDDADVRTTAAWALQDLGYDVLEADSGAAALLALEHDSEIDLMLVDFAMPGMNGMAVAEAAHARLPGLPVLFATGYADITALADATRDEIIRKPYTLDELAEKVATALARSRQPARQAAAQECRT